MMDCVKIFQFGSSIYKNNPNDIDLLIIYSKFELQTIESYITLRKQIKLQLYNNTKIPIDIIMLSEKEENQLNYVSKINSYRLL